MFIGTELSLRARWLVCLATMAVVGSGVAQAGKPAAVVRRQCFMLQTLDGSVRYVSDATECAVRTAPASTFKIPHSLVALDLGVVTDPKALVKWDGSEQPFEVWKRDHSLDSAVRNSVFWFFQRTARSIGRERMLASLARLGYTKDTFEGDVASFWVNGDLVVSPAEQLTFLRRMMSYELPVRRSHIDAVKEAFRMPAGKITNASGVHPFGLVWPAGTVVRAKTGNTTVHGERVSWLVGHLESAGEQYVFVSRVRSNGPLAGTAGADVALKRLNERSPEGKRGGTKARLRTSIRIRSPGRPSPERSGRSSLPREARKTYRLAKDPALPCGALASRRLSWRRPAPPPRAGGALSR